MEFCNEPHKTRSPRLDALLVFVLFLRSRIRNVCKKGNVRKHRKYSENCFRENGEKRAGIRKKEKIAQILKYRVEIMNEGTAGNRKIIHTGSGQNFVRNELYTKLSTLSTEIRVDTVGILGKIRNECFVRLS